MQPDTGAAVPLKMGALGLIPVAFLVWGIGLALGGPTGYAINPARDLGPRVFTYLAGWGSEVFRAGNYWWWVPIVGPLVGGVLGGWIYDAFVGKHFPTK
jgi:glycerol uptake facilitator-like aquaporin